MNENDETVSGSMENIDLGKLDPRKTPCVPDRITSATNSFSSPRLSFRQDGQVDVPLGTSPSDKTVFARDNSSWERAISHKSSAESLQISVESFSVGKNADTPEINEDIFARFGKTFVIADGMTAKGSYEPNSSKERSGKSAGKIAADLVADTVSKTDLNGKPLVDYITEKMKSFYIVNYPEALEDPTLRFAATMVTARVLREEIIITQVGDSAFRINGNEVYSEHRQIDILDARARSAAIIKALEEGKVEAEAVRIGREQIEPSLKCQYTYRNNPDHELGFAYIDGSEVPDKFVKEYHFPLAGLSTLEFFTDGYVIPPSEITIEAWEQTHAQVCVEDPYRYKKYLATKPSDDRTVAIIRFSALSSLTKSP